MEAASIETAARLIVQATRREIPPPDRLPEDVSPKTAAEALAIQDKVIDLLGETVVGWKVAVVDGEVLRGAVLASRKMPTGAVIPAGAMPLCGIEAEIAFRFDRDMPYRPEGYSEEELAAAVTAMVVIEVVDTRFASYQEAPFLDRAADFMSNGGFVIGTVRDDWRSFDLAKLEVAVTAGGEEIARGVGGHIAGNPILPALALVNDHKAGIAKGTFISTGTFSGLKYAKPGDAVHVAFEGFGAADLTLAA